VPDIRRTGLSPSQGSDEWRPHEEGVACDGADVGRVPAAAPQEPGAQLVSGWIAEPGARAPVLANGVLVRRGTIRASEKARWLMVVILALAAFDAGLGLANLIQ
jgi:hypothetical protein